MTRLLPILIALTLVAVVPVATAKGIRFYDCGSYGPGMSCVDHRDLLTIESDLIPYDWDVCLEVFYPSASC